MANILIPSSQLVFVRQTDPLPLKLVHQQDSDCLALMNYGGKTIQNLTYQAVFLGAAWQSKLLSGLIAKLTTSLSTAMQSTKANTVFTQYFNNNAVAAMPLPPKSYMYVGHSGKADVSWKANFYGEDVRQTISFLRSNGMLPADLKNYAVLLVLAPGTILYKRADSSGADVPVGFFDSMSGLASYHHFVQFGTDRVYYGVSVWSDGENGTALPGWQPWENTCAGLYHELAEIRTNPDNEGDAPTKIWGWASCEGDEIGDLAVSWAGDNPSLVFKKDLAVLRHVPIQLLWSNQLRKPYTP